jgi:hypothetical protein
MSNSKTAISEIKKLMVQFGFLASEPTLQSFKLEDNTILEAESLKVGNEIFKINELFERVKLENGSYLIPNNFELEVKDGKISVVKEIFIDAKLKDGTAISIKGPGVEPGAKIFVMKDGVPTPAPDDTHELEDGTQVTTKDGEIISVETPAEQANPEEGTPAEEAAESPAEEGAEPVSPVDKKTTEEDGKLNPQMMDEMYSMLKEFVTKVHSKMADMEGQYKSLQNEFEAFKKEPAGEKIKYSKTDSFAKQDDVIEDKIASIMALRNKK